LNFKENIIIVLGNKRRLMEKTKDMKSQIVSKKPDVKWDDIAGLTEAKKQLQEAVILPVKFP